MKTTDWKMIDPLLRVIPTTEADWTADLIDWEKVKQLPQNYLTK